MRNTLWAILLLAVVFVAGIYFSRFYWNVPKSNAQEQSQVLLEKVKTVCKLVTVEGYFTEVYDYKDYWGYDVSLFRKKALVRVKAKVSVGYDLGKLKVTSKPQEKTIALSALPEPEIISIDHDLDYYDITEGTFNSFTTDDYNKINQKAKDYIREQVQKSELMQSARKEGNQMIDMMRLVVESAGWKLEVEGQNLKD